MRVRVYWLPGLIAAMVAVLFVGLPVFNLGVRSDGSTGERRASLMTVDLGVAVPVGKAAQLLPSIDPDHEAVLRLRTGEWSGEVVLRPTEKRSKWEAFLGSTAMTARAQDVVSIRGVIDLPGIQAVVPSARRVS